MNDSVYNSTTVSYENPGGSPNVRPWNLSEMVSPPPIRTKYLHWLLLVGGVLGIVIGVTASFVGIYSHTAELDSPDHSPSGWIAAVLGLVVTALGIFLMFFYCRLTNNRFFCHRLSNTRNALRKVITKPRFHNAQANRGANLLANESSSFQPALSAQYDPVPDIGFNQANGDVSEERAKLMMHEAKEGRPALLQHLDDDDERLEFDEPVDIRNTYKSGRMPGLEWGCIGDLRRTSSMHSPHQQSMAALAASSTSNCHYKPRHFAGHGYGLSNKGRTAPLASMEEITPSLRSSFASVLMYPPSSWGASDESLPSDFFAHDYESGSLKKQDSVSALSVQSDFQ